MQIIKWLIKVTVHEHLSNKTAVTGLSVFFCDLFCWSGCSRPHITLSIWSFALLVQDDPRERPFALELLRSSLLPPKMEVCVLWTQCVYCTALRNAQLCWVIFLQDEYMKDAVRTLANPHTSFYHRFVFHLLLKKQLLCCCRSCYLLSLYVSHCCSS